jgi:hypothetical protein
MKANELRIGNYVDLGGHRNLYKIKDEELSGLNLNGESLTIEWVLLFGFKDSNNGIYLDEENDIELFYINDLYFNLSYKNTVIDNDLYYVHQLQNLYFALTENEIEIIPKRTTTDQTSYENRGI